MTIYLDNNATTLMPESVQRALIGGCNLGNPSSTPQASGYLSTFKKTVCTLSNITEETHQIIITSGASEGNAAIIHMVKDAFMKLGKKARILATNIEHKSVLRTIEQLEADGLINSVIVPVGMDGRVPPVLLERALAKFPDVALAMIMQVNNELGSINNIPIIGRICRATGTPLFVDAVQAYGKYPIKPTEYNVDAFTFSMHKIYGPPGVGCLVLSKALIANYALHGIIGGTQNDGFRGGTENLCGVAASVEALRIAFEHRDQKNLAIANMREYLLKQLQARFALMTYAAYMAGGPASSARSFQERSAVPPSPLAAGRAGNGGSAAARIVILTPLEKNASLPTTLLISIIGKGECNRTIRDELMKFGIYISIGSACNIKDMKPSHVLEAIGAPKEISDGTIRISIGDFNTTADIDSFVENLRLLL